MDLGALGVVKAGGLSFFAIIAAVTAGTALSVFLACYYWFRREQRRFQARILAVVTAGEQEGGLDSRGPRSGELVAQFTSKQGRQIISVLEADGKRFLHIDGEISAPERAKMVRYLRSEGFMS